MIEKILRSEITQRKLIILAEEALHFDSSITRFIMSGSGCSIRCIGGTYKLLRGYPPSPQVETDPSPLGEGFFLLFYLLSYKKIVLYILVKVDGHVSRASRDKCPEDIYQSSIFIELIKIINPNESGISLTRIDFTRLA